MSFGYSAILPFADERLPVRAFVLCNTPPLLLLLLRLYLSLKGLQDQGTLFRCQPKAPFSFCFVTC